MNAARAFLLALLLCWASIAFADVAVPPLSGRVVDNTGTLSSGDIASLTQTLQNLEARKGSQVAVLIVPTTAPESIEQYSIRVAEAWKIGRRKVDDGALVVVAKDDRKLRIEVGYGLEGALNDATAKRIIDEVITPKFRSGDFAGGIFAGVYRIIAVIDGEKLPAPEARRQQDSGLLSHVDPLNPIFIFILFIVGAALRSTFGRLIGGVAIGSIVGGLAWFVAGSLAAAIILALVAFLITMLAESATPLSGRRGSWSSGGGGSFGGGGASGSW